MKAKHKTPRYRFTFMIITMAVVWAVSMGLQGAELGRLFTTPQERAALDKLRREGPPPVAEPKEPAPPEQPEHISEAQLPESITVNGLVRRSDGANTVWINGVNSLEGEFDSQGFHVDERGIRNDRVIVTVSGRPGQQIEMRPGQTFDPAARRMMDVYEVPKEQVE